MSTAERDDSCNESLHDLIARQFGLITVAQAASFGISKQAVSRRVASGEWVRVLPGVYRATAAELSSRQNALGAALWAGEGALVSHSTAALLWEFDGIRSPKVELWVPAKRGPRSSLIVVHRGGRLDRADRTELDGIPITTPIRTLIDMSGRLEDHRLLSVTEDLIRRRVIEPDRLAARLRALRTSGRPGAGRLEALLEQRGDGRALESPLEALVWQIIVASGVRLPERQHWVTMTEGRYRLDFAWPDLRLGLECDGYGPHGGRARWDKDRARLADLGSVEWRVLPITWQACTRERERVILWLTRAVPKSC